MKNIFEQLTDLLKKDERLVSQDGVLLKNQTQELARKNDLELIKLLLSDKAIKQHFFFEVEKTLIFDKEKFIRFISNKQFLPDSYTAFKNKIGLTAGDEYLSENKDVVLVWPYKDCVLEGGMTKEDQKRDEIFYNETLAPDDINRLFDAKVFTNFKRIDKKGEHKLDSFNRDGKGIIKDNLIIKGNNLLALVSLKKEFSGKVKLIYIDPPYNTGNDGFRYNDSFNHSSWLVFMKNRLEIAQQLLRDDGVIFVQCDDSEQAYLKVLMDNIFDRNNFLNQITWERSAVAGLGLGGNFAANVSEYILAYSKNISSLSINNDFVFEKIFSVEKLKGYGKILNKSGNKQLVKEFLSKSNGEKVKIFKHNDFDIKNININKLPIKEISKTYIKHFNNIFRTFLVQKENKFQHDLIDTMNDGFYSVEYTPSRGKNSGKKTTLYYLNKELCGFLNGVAKIEDDVVIKLEKPCDFWSRDDISNAARGEGGVKGVDRMKKPEKLLHRIMEWTTQYGDVVLDFFAGSGTTLAVAHKIRRQYIGIEQMDYIHELPESRLKNIISGDQTGISKEVGWKGGGDFIYMELAEWNEQWIKKIRDAKTEKELAKLWDGMKETAFLSYKVDPKTVDTNAKDFADLSIADQKKFLIECLDKNQLYINLSEIEDKEYGVSKEDKESNKSFYENKSNL